MNKKVFISKMILGVLLMFCLLCLAGCKENYDVNEHTLDEDFDNITLLLDTSDVEFLPAKDGKLRVVCYDKKNLNHRISVSRGELKIEIDDARRWYQKIFNTCSPSITLYLPKTDFSALNVESDTGNLKVSSGFIFNSINIALSTGDVEISGVECDGNFNIRVSTGDVALEDISCGRFESFGSTGDITVHNLTAKEGASIERSTGSIDLYNLNLAGNLDTRVSTGKSKLSSVTCDNFTSVGDTGNLEMSNVVAKGRLSVERDTGKVDFDGCDAAEVYIETSTGDVEGSFLTDKIVFARTSTGKIDVPKLTSGGRCEIETSTGDIEISIK